MIRRPKQKEVVEEQKEDSPGEGEKEEGEEEPKIEIPNSEAAE